LSEGGEGGAALKEIGAAGRQETRRWLNNRAETFHCRFDDDHGLCWVSHAKLQKFAAVHGSVCNHFNQERSLSCRNIFKLNRTAALAEWPSLFAA